ncbi:MAG: 50S ribosomal protein L4 [Actinomycetota bacterium]|nr:50S ribosomal protein L4 [Actinomycetota bacterium]
MAATAPVLGLDGSSSRRAELADEVFAAEVKRHLIHETVRAEAAAARRGTHATKSRGLVSGGRSKPWRQKGTGRARAGSIRAPQWTGGGRAFALEPRSYELKVNRKARKTAFRGALSAHVEAGSLAVVDGSAFDRPSTRQAAELVASWGGERPLVVVAAPGEEAVAKSFRNLERVTVLEPSELEVAALVWARSLLVTEAALARIEEVAV